MALSNIFNEPRREIVETVIGVGVGGGLLAAGFAVFHVFGVDAVMNFIMFALFGFALLMGAILLLIVLHGWGEAMCDALERRGVQMRPRQRR